ncbi:MAG: hypothetical protein U0414_08810 [Polyangiaceae bacterium]
MVERAPDGKGTVEVATGDVSRRSALKIRVRRAFYPAGAFHEGHHRRDLEGHPRQHAGVREVAQILRAQHDLRLRVERCEAEIAEIEKQLPAA